MGSPVLFMAVFLIPFVLVGLYLAGNVWTAILGTVLFPEDPVSEGLFEVLGADEGAVRGLSNEARRAFLCRMEGFTLAGEGDLFTFERYVRGGSPLPETAGVALPAGYDPGRRPRQQGAEARDPGALAAQSVAPISSSRTPTKVEVRSVRCMPSKPRD